MNEIVRQCGVLMVQGTTSDAGKSTLVTALCRILARRNIAVAPFKPQNMALNSAVTTDGGEIGRAQAVQAQACFIEPHTDMNPVLLKPCTDTAAQIIIHGRALTDMEAAAYHDYKSVAMGAVLASYQRLRERYRALIVEGAGSPAEINLRDRDIANMGFAEAVDCPVILIADIDRGGVFAHLVGTLALLSESEQQRIRGFVINRFRGDIALLQPGLDWLQEKTGKPVLGVLPYLQGFHLEAEDALARSAVTQPGNRVGHNRITVIVPALPRISNHTDFDSLRLHPQVDFRFIGPHQAIPAADLIVLPGSKNVRADLHWLRAQGWQGALEKHLRYGGKVIGICGGLQMLGLSIDDPEGIEGSAGSASGFGWLPVITRLQPGKQLRRVTGTLFDGATPLTGYEIHAGISDIARQGGGKSLRAATHIDGRPEGCISEDNQILGTYVHGLFDHPRACSALLSWAGLTAVASWDYPAFREAQIERLADAVEQALDMDRILSLLSLTFKKRNHR